MSKAGYIPDSSTGVSVVVCCYNSSARLPATLEHLARQSLPAGLPVEVIVVDNNSKDRTAETALGEWERLGNPFPLRAIHQPVQGLAYARELGIESAGLEYILLCDDDNWLDPDYIATAFEAMSSDPETGILGGRGEAVSDGPLPHWFSSFQSAYAVGVQAMESGDVSKRGYLWGAGMVLRRPVFLSLKKAGFSSLLADRKGEQLSSGGDSEYCKWFLMAGYTLRYDERLVYRHFIPSERLTRDYFRKMQRGHDQSFRVLKKYDQVLSAQLKSPFRRFLRLLGTGFGLLQSLFLLNENASRFYLEQFSIYIPFGNLGPDPEIRKNTPDESFGEKNLVGRQPMTRPKISIVTPSFNQAGFIEETILSVLDQAYPNLEYIIIDGGSTDGTAEIIKKYEKHLHYWVSEPDAGMYDAVQKGFEKSSGELMAWINSDDLLHRGALNTVSELFSSFPQVDWIQGLPSFFDEQGRIVQTGGLKKWSPFHFYLGDFRWIQQESSFWRRSLWDKAGGQVNRSLKYAGDFDLWLRFFRHASLHSCSALLGGFRLRKSGQLSQTHLREYLAEAKNLLDSELENLPEEKENLVQDQDETGHT